MLPRLIERFLWPARDRDRGAMAVEFAIAVPILAMLVIGVADYGSLMNTAATLRGATRAGAEYVRANWNNPAISVATNTTNAKGEVCGFLGLTLSGSSCSPVTPSVSSACTCVDGTSVGCPASGGSNPCIAETDPRVLVAVTVTASQSFSPMFSWAGFAFPATVTAETTVRTQ